MLSTDGRHPISYTPRAFSQKSVERYQRPMRERGGSGVICPEPSYISQTTPDFVLLQITVDHELHQFFDKSEVD